MFDNRRTHAEASGIWEKIMWGIASLGIVLFGIFLTIGITLNMFLFFLVCLTILTSFIVLVHYFSDSVISTEDIPQRVEHPHDQQWLAWLEHPYLGPYYPEMLELALKELVRHNNVAAIEGLNYRTKRFLIETGRPYRACSIFETGLIEASRSEPEVFLALLRFPLRGDERLDLLSRLIPMICDHSVHVRNLELSVEAVLAHHAFLDPEVLQLAFSHLLLEGVRFRQNAVVPNRLYEKFLEIESISETVKRTILDHANVCIQIIDEAGFSPSYSGVINGYRVGGYEILRQLAGLSIKAVNLPEDILSLAAEKTCENDKPEILEEAWSLQKSPVFRGQNRPVLFLKAVVEKYKPLLRLREIWVKTCSMLHIRQKDGQYSLPRLPREIWVNIMRYVAIMEGIPHAEVAAWVATQPKMATLQDTARVMGIPVETMALR